jgi:hypothetical protein
MAPGVIPAGMRGCHSHPSRLEMQKSALDIEEPVRRQQ